MTFLGQVQGSPPGNSGKKGEVWMNIPHHLRADSWSPTNGSYDDNKVTWKGVTFTDNGNQSFTVTATVLQSAPCNHVATTVLHVNGLGSEQVQVRVQCPEAGADVTQPGGAPGAGQSEANITRFNVVKTAEFEGQKLERIEAKHLGKHITYNILIRRNGEPPKGRIRIVEDMLEMCDATSLQSIQNAVELHNAQGERLRVGDDFTLNDKCQLTILGDAKDGPGNDLHFKLKVLLAPSFERVTTSVLTNKVRVAVLGQGGAVVEQEGVAGVLGIAIAPEILPPSARGAPGGAPQLISLPGPVPGEAPEIAGEVPAVAVEMAEVAAAEAALAPEMAPAALPSAGGPGLPAATGLAGATLAALGWLLRRRLN